MKRRILALVLALVMAVGLALPASAEGLDGGSTGEPVVITGTDTDTPTPTEGGETPAAPTTPVDGGETPTPPTTGESAPTPDGETPATPVDGEDEGEDDDESGTPAPLGMAAPMSVGATPTTATTPTTKSVEYVDENGDIKTVTATKVEYTSTTTGGAWSAGWYYVEEDTSLTGVAWDVSGDVKLILCDGATLKKVGNNNLFINSGTSSLTIYGQSAQTGKLEACITGVSVGDTTLTVNGGVVVATGNDTENVWSYGIEVNKLTVNGGKVIATGGVVSSSIPAAKSYGIKGSVTFNGGTLIAEAGAVGNTKAAFSADPKLSTGSTTYYWRTAESGDGSNFTASTTKAYIHNSLSTYVELTTIPNGGGYISYMAWNDTTKKITPAFIVDSDTARTVVSNQTTWSGGTSDAPAWYVVKEDVTIGSSVTVTGHVNLLLCDGKTLTVTANNMFASGIQIGDGRSGASLTIYGQSGQTGALTSTATDAAYHGIFINTSSSLNINGGKVTATSNAQSGYGIKVGIGSTLTVNSGNVTAGGDSYGIWVQGSVTINGGTLIAKCNSSAELKAAITEVPTLPTVPYWWRTAEDGKYTRSGFKTYTPGGEAYAEITTTQPADDQLDRVGYLDWNEATGALDTELTYREDAIEVAGLYAWGTENETTWYYVKDRTGEGTAEDYLTIEGSMTVKGDVHLILCDGADLTVTGGIKIENGASLTIYGQTKQTGTAKFQSSGSGNGISINGDSSLTINGGEISATGGSAEGTSSGIQVGSSSKGTMTVNSGKVTATGGGGTSISNSYGISVNKSVSSLTINGGEVTAIGRATTDRTNPSSYGIYSKGTVTFNGGTVIAKRAEGEGQAVYSYQILNLPTVPYWWRTAEAASYKTQRTDVRSYLLRGEYFELTTTLQTEVDATEAAKSVDYMDWDEATGALKKETCSDYVPVISRSCDATWGVMASEEPTWYYVAESATIDGTVTLEGDVCLILGDGATLTVKDGISGNASDLTIYGQSEQTGKLATTGAEKSSYSGIEVGRLTVNGGEVTATGGAATKGYEIPGGTRYYMSCGIRVNNGDCVINAGKVTATGGISYNTGDYGSSGIAVNNTMYSLYINGGEVTATGGAAEKSGGAMAVKLVVGNDAKLTATGGSSTDAVKVECSYGIDALMMNIGGSAKVTAIGGKATEKSYGLYLEDWSEDTYDLRMTSGTLIARTLADSCTDKAAMYYNDDLTTLPDTYWWRTAESGSFTGCANGRNPYVNGANTYAEITSTRPEGWVEPTEQPEDQEQDRTDGSSVHQPIRRQNGTVAALIPAAPDKADVTSPETFDAGIAVYVGLGVLSLTGSAAWLGKRKK